jgi:TonB-dependent SusC/RagA subfamily outer membrane receptor
VSNLRAFPRARAALALIPLAAALACASGGSRQREPEPLAKPPLSDTASVAIGDGRTLENMIAGRFPGVSVLRVEGGGIQIRIRGGGNPSLGGDEPLYVVDDVPLPQGNGGILYINPYDIAKIEVLKNPSDTAIYGARGGEGVVKITTRKPEPPKQ